MVKTKGDTLSTQSERKLSYYDPHRTKQTRKRNQKSSPSETACAVRRLPHLLCEVAIIRQRLPRDVQCQSSERSEAGSLYVQGGSSCGCVLASCGCGRSSSGNSGCQSGCEGVEDRGGYDRLESFVSRAEKSEGMKTPA